MAILSIVTIALLVCVHTVLAEEKMNQECADDLKNENLTRDRQSFVRFICDDAKNSLEQVVGVLERLTLRGQDAAGRRILRNMRYSVGRVVRHHLHILLSSHTRLTPLLSLLALPSPPIASPVH